MTHNQPWNVAGFNPQSAGGVQMFDPSKFQTTATASLVDSGVSSQKLHNTAQFPSEPLPTSVHNSVEAHNHYQNPHGTGMSAGPNQGQMSMSWGTVDQWQQGQQGNHGTQLSQPFVSEPFQHSQGQNYFNAGDPQQWQNWNTQQGHWDSTGQHPQQMQPQQIEVNPTQWSQVGDPVWSEPEPWLNENSSWGMQSSENQSLGTSTASEQFDGQFNNSSSSGAFGQGQGSIKSSTSQQYNQQTVADSFTNSSVPFTYGSSDSAWGLHTGNEGPASFNTTPNSTAAPEVSLGAATVAGSVDDVDVSHNDSGTVSSFFGGDDTYEGEVSNSGASDRTLDAPVNPAMLRVPHLNRTASEISNSSLVTYHNSSLESLDAADVGQDLGELSEKMQSASIQDSQPAAPNTAPPPSSAHQSQQGPLVSEELNPSVQAHMFLDSHSLSSHHSGDSLGYNLNQSSLGVHSHHSSLDSSDLGLGSGFSSGPGTPGQPTVDFSIGQEPQNENSPRRGDQTQPQAMPGYQHHPQPADTSLASSSAKRNLNESFQGNSTTGNMPVLGASVSNVQNIEGPVPSHPAATWHTNSSERDAVLHTGHPNHSDVSVESATHQTHFEISSGNVSEPNLLLDTSGSSSLNASSDTIVVRPSSAFKPLVKSPSTSRQNSLSSNPGDSMPPHSGISKKPPRPPSEGREFGHNPLHRPHSRQKHRNDNNVSPATTLWAPPESSFHAPVILAPAAPQALSPQASPTHKTEPVTAAFVKHEKNVKSETHQPQTDTNLPENQRQSTEDRRTSKMKSSSDIKETPRREDVSEKSRSKLDYDYDNKPRRKGRNRRQPSQETSNTESTKAVKEASDRPPSRNDSLKDEYINSRYGDGYYQDQYGYRSRRGYEEEYDRPRSRQDEERRPRSRAEYDRPRSRTDYDRPKSRTDYDRPKSRTDYDRPRSRTDYDRPRSRAEYDHYYDRDYRGRYKGYDYDPYYRHGYYYDRDYYDYHQNRYAMGYYDEYYRSAYDDRYQQNYYQESVATYDDTDRLSQMSVPSRGQTPADEIDQQSVRDHHGYNRTDSHQHQYSHYDNHSYANAGYDNMGYGYGYHGYDYSGYGEYDAKPEAIPKFSLPHIAVRFGPGGHLITVQPHRPAEGQPALVQVHELQELFHEDEEAEEIEEFPGPLIKGETHKNDVLVFCQRRARECKDDVDMIDRDSAELLWKFLELLIKQNGTVVGTDISDLLLEGHEPTTLEYKSSGVKISTSQSQSMENLAEEVDEDTEKSLTIAADRSQINRRKSMSVEEVTDRFRHLLLYGRKKDSLDWAMKHNLWGHALFLASKMDTRTHANVMIRFANSSMRMNDPLQTLYQLMSGRQPAAVTCISDERWGDWRPHLAMILSNHTSKPDVDRKSIVTLGDTLASRGYLHASHFCYLMAQVGFGTYNKKTSKLVLVGSSHNLPFDEFSSNRAVQCTEVYEYALSLGNPLSTLASFQPYKFIYACRMAEFGFTQASLHYCEVIAGTVNQAPGLYHLPLLKQLLDLSCRLKYYDPQRQEVGYEIEDPYWLQQLQRSCYGLEDGSIQPISGSATPLGYGTTTGSSESGEIAGLTSAAEMPYTQYQGGVPEQENPQGYTAEQWEQQQQQQYVQDGGEVTGQAEAVQYNQYTGEETQQQTEQNYAAQTYDPNQYNQGYNYGYQQTDGSYGYSGQTAYDPSQEKRYSQDSTVASDSGFVGDPTGFGARRYSVSGITEESGREETDGLSASTHSTDYWGACTNLPNKVYGAPIRQRSTSGGSSISSGRQRTMSGSSTHSIKASPYINKTAQQTKTASKNKPSNNAGGSGKGILSFLASKLPFSTPKNEMKLPKDENPTIIWDSVKNRWVNTEGEEEPETPAAPPPKDSELSGPSVGSTVGTMGPPGGNRFQKPTARGARSRYVDVLNPGSTTSSSTTASIPSSLFNVMPTTTSTPQNIFIPGAGASNSSTMTSDLTVSESNATPLPSASSELATSTGNQHSRSSSLSSLSREVQQFTQQAIAQAEQEAQDTQPSNPPGVPMMFNPSQFSQGQQNSNQSATSASSRPRYGQRRQYPKRN